MNDFIGSYNPGLFYSESFSGIFNEHIFFPKDIGNEDSHGYTNYGWGVIPGGLLKTQRIVTVIHECLHYMHDLSLGAAMEADFLLDQSSHMIFKLVAESSNSNKVKFPLNSYLETRSNFSPYQKILQAISDIDKYAHILITDSDSIALYEGIAAETTLLTMGMRAYNNPEKQQYLNKNLIDLKLDPNSLPSIYTASKTLYIDLLNKTLPWIRKYSYSEWPQKYPNSNHNATDMGFIGLADIALHVPPTEISNELIKTGHNKKRHFIPHTRFVDAINVIKKRGSFPDLDENGTSGFHRHLYNTIAKDPELQWPTFDETQNNWILKLSEMNRRRGSASDGYRYRFAVEKLERTNDLLYKDPIESLGKQWAPIFHLTPAGFKIIKILIYDGKFLVIPFEIEDISAEFTSHMSVKPWEHYMPTNMDSDSILMSEHDKVDLFLFEITNRILCRSLQKAMMYENYYKCPFSQGGCSTREDICASINEMKALPKKGCHVRKYLKEKKMDAKQIVWN